MKMDIFSVDIPDSCLKEKLREIEEVIRHTNWKIDSFNSQIKDVKLEILFHNGWTTVNKSTVKLI